MAAVAPPAVVLGEKPRFKYRDPGRMAFLARQRHVTERKTRWSVPQVEEALRVRLVTNRVMARRAFRALDLDGSGSLCQVEIRKLLHLFNIELTDGDWKKCWAWMDMDGSGALDINEFFVRFGSDHGTMLSIGDELKHLSADGAAPKKSPRRPSEPKSQGAPVPLTATKLDSKAAPSGPWHPGCLPCSGAIPFGRMVHAASPAPL